jgi:hypothetical protein
MQINSVYLYPNKIDAYTNPLDSLTAERYRRVYNRNLKVYRSVDNRIDLQLRNSDQKALTINSSVVFNIIGRNANNLLVQKDFTLIEDNATLKIKGRAYVTLTTEDLQDLDPGFYQYSIIQETRESIEGTDEYKVTASNPLYTDSQYGVVGTIEISGDVFGTVTNSVVVDKFSYTNPFTVGDPADKFYISSIIDAQPGISPAQPLHTFQLYFKDYTGTVTIEGSNDEQGATPKHWVAITPEGDGSAAIDLVSQSDLIYKNIVGKFNWFRIKHIPTTNNTGTVDKILYR